ncbi:hypothetical protein [Parapedobacter lycopersici]|uniref:hypothetical protein n=1 Tax=Parapedobacter lycopersici TaxID=1864939 RepID=UPI0033405D7F
MKTYLQAYFDELKGRVLDKSEITQIVPADCYRLALDIKTATHKSVSETTIKRVFGFASSIHQPSIYTLNALAEYCGFTSWDSFYTHMEQDKLQTSQQKSWSEVLVNATKISLFSIQSNKHKCGIPYHKTVDRENMVHFVDHLHGSGATVGILSGPVGCGKTIAVTRWVEQQISQSHTNNDSSIFLFTNSLSLLQGTAFGYHSNRWLAHLLGMDSAELLDRFMDDHKNAAPGKFYLVIDEFHSDLVADRQFYTVIKQFVEMVRHFAQYKWFRIILVLRTTTLFKYETLFSSTATDPLWFSSLSGTAESVYASIDSFSRAELHRLSRKFHLPVTTKSLITQHSIIKNPLFFQYFYECYGADMDPTNVSPFDEYVITVQYIKKKIFNGINTIAKQALMEELSDLVDKENLFVNRKQAYGIIKLYRTAYNDLLYSGILNEKGTGLEMRQQTFIEFQSIELIAYFKALKFFNQQYTVQELIDHLNYSTAGTAIKVSQLKWLLLFYIEAKDTSLLHHLSSISFIKSNPFHLIAFACDGLQKFGLASQCSTGGNSAQSMVHLHDNSFVHYVSSQLCFQPKFGIHAEKLLDFELATEQEIILRSKLAVIALLRWDEKALLNHLAGLAALPAGAYAGLMVNPLNLLTYLYHYFDHRTVEDSLVFELDKLAIQLSYPADIATDYHFDVLLYLAIKVTEHQEMARKYGEVIRQRLEKTDPERIYEIDFTIMMHALFLLESGDETAASQCIEQLSTSNLQQYPVLNLLHTIFNIHVLKLHGESCRHLVQSAIIISESYGFKLLEAYCSLLLLDEMPKNKQLRQLSHLKFQFTSALPSYMRTSSLPNNYG